MEDPQADDQLEMVKEEKRVVRKLDLILMPILTITLGLQVCPKMVGTQA
jgi:hypothetical protein